MLNLGTVAPGSTIFIPFESFGNSNPGSITLTGLATSDILAYKDGGTTQRASTSGYTLLDSDGIDFDGITGIHGLSIDLSDNATADFWAAGSRYFIVVSTVTVDSQTISFVAATFRIGYPGAVLDTTIATLGSQTSFTLTTGPAEDNALKDSWAVIHDAASAVQTARVRITGYTGSTKTVTLATGASFTVAAKDNISIMGPAPVGAAASEANVSILPGAVNQTVDVFIPAFSTGAGLTGLAYNSPGLACYYRRGATGAATALSLATQTVGGAHSDGGFVEISASNSPGMYRLDLSDAIVAAGVDTVTLYLHGSANMSPAIVHIDLEDKVALTDVLSDGVALNSDNGSLVWPSAWDAEVGDAVLSRNVSNVEATAGEHTLCTVILAMLEHTISGTTLTIKRTNGSTTHYTKTLTTDSGASPITGIT